MMLYLLDTDHLSHYHRGHAAMMKHLADKTSAQVFISIITSEEILRGRLAQIRAAKTEAEHIKACYWLGDSLDRTDSFYRFSYA